jgi:hypothetical protein
MSNKVTLEQVWNQSNAQLKAFIIGRGMIPNNELQNNRVIVSVFYFKHKFLTEEDMKLVQNKDFNNAALQHEDLATIRESLAKIDIDQVWNATLAQVNLTLMRKKLKPIGDETTSKIRLLKSYHKYGMLNPETERMFQRPDFEEVLRSYPYPIAKKLLMADSRS